MFSTIFCFVWFLVVLVLLALGFNYARIPFAQQLNLTEIKMDSTALRQELEASATETSITSLRFATSIDSVFFDKNLEHKIRQDVYNLLKNNNLQASLKLRGRQIKPKGTLCAFGITGIYMPFVGESNIEAGLHDLEKPFTMAHEMAHGFGWTDEATANLIAYLACVGSSDAYTQYSGCLNYYRYVASNYRRLDPEAYKIFRETLPQKVRNDLDAINKRQKSLKTWFDTSAINDVYLKSQGVREGVGSYSRVVTWVYAWRMANATNK
ncbi:MAG: DUF3810 domain-containing protein [Saprospiraceae bacterium]|nr:DUF3810 domain-containing protein [Saprospiraceae bacterium]